MTTTINTLQACAWPRARLVDAIHSTARMLGVRGTESRTPRASAQPSSEIVSVFVDLPDLANDVGLHAEQLDLPAANPLIAVRLAAPMLIDRGAEHGFLLVVGANDRRIVLLGPNGRTRIPAAVFDRALSAMSGADAGVFDPNAAFGAPPASFDFIPSTRRAAVQRILLAPQLIGRPLAQAWALRARSVGVRQELRAANIGRRIAGIFAAYLVQLGLFLAIWRQVGTRTFDNHGARGVGWGIFFALLGAWAIVQLSASAGISRLALDVGAVVRTALVRGALRLDPTRMRNAGVGQLLGRALDAEVLDALALGGGVEAAAGACELILGIVVLVLAATPVWSIAIVACVVYALFALTRLHARRLSVWGDTRRALTHDLVERMVGHRTVLIQDRPDRTATADQAALRGYDAQTVSLDRAEVFLGVGVARAFLLASLLALMPVVVGAQHADVAGAAVAMTVGGIWLAYGALRRLGVALPTLSLARESWRHIAPLVGATEPDTAPDTSASTRTTPADEPSADAVVPLIQATAVSFRYAGRGDSVLRNVDLAIGGGERILIEGASGGGKSTLAALLTGMKVPSQGRLQLNGADQNALGLARWRHAVAGAPQFHDNHVLGTDLLFNLLMGRRWPPRIEDIVAAERVCRALGLQPLLDRMPAGLQQMVGETGWQLSHGERSRVFIARSLLQSLSARVLDESFAALDPQTLDDVLTTVLSHPEALIVIAHP
jgi:ATP-binding cassette subfamily B protein